MMNNEEFSEKIKSAFADTKPSPQLISRLAENNTKRRRINHPIFRIAVIVAALLIIGSAGVYAASEMNFINVFGDYIHVSDKELADSLMGSVHNFKYKVSDDAYAIRINGITGDRKNMIFEAEIYRKDGTPVIDYFKNLPDEDTPDKNMLYMPLEHFVLFVNCSSGWDAMLNDDGNIKLRFEMNSSKNNLKGKKFTAEGSDIYPFEKEWNFQRQNKVYFSYSLTKHEKTLLSMENINQKADISDDDIIGLRLDWSFSFRYNPSEKSEMKKVSTETDKTFDLNSIAIYTKTDQEKNEEDKNTETLLTCKPSKIEFTSIGGSISYSFVSDKINNTEYIMKPSENDFYIINDDGSKTYLVFTGESTRVSGEAPDTCTVEASIDYIEYTGENEDGSKTYDKIFTDVSKFKELHLNDTVYELK